MMSSPIHLGVVASLVVALSTAERVVRSVVELVGAEADSLRFLPLLPQVDEQ